MASAIVSVLAGANTDVIESQAGSLGYAEAH